MNRLSIILSLALGLLLCSFTQADPPAKSKPKKPRQKPFRWVNPMPKGKFPGVKHGTYSSKVVGQDVGYCIYLPPQYHDSKNAKQRFPVVYYLHGGRPGGETKSIRLSQFIDKTIRDGNVPPMIYVFVNGGVVSHYNYPKLKSPGETAFITELIPHIDIHYRTIASRDGRGLEGFSQGGRGTARHMFKYPHLFSSAAPMGGGHQHEKRISENDGDEGFYKFTQGDNSYDLARRYAADPKRPPLRILVMFGTKDFNYEANLAYMEHLKSLKIPFEHKIVADAPHSAAVVYKQQGLRAMKFHADNFQRATKQK